MNNRIAYRSGNRGSDPVQHFREDDGIAYKETDGKDPKASRDKEGGILTMVKCDKPQDEAQVAEHHKTEDTPQCPKEVHDIHKPY